MPGAVVEGWMRTYIRSIHVSMWHGVDMGGMGSMDK